MRIYIIGCGGMLGQEVYHYFKSKGHDILSTDIDVNERWLQYQDIRNYTSLFENVTNFKPDIIMNLAADTDLERCEMYQHVAMTTNAGGSANCVMLAELLDVPYLYVSTAGIFDGKQEFYDDYANPNPLCVYAKSKYMGEQFAQSTKKHIVLRCGWSMGSGPKDKKFIQKIWQQIKSGATELNVVTDKQGTPTYVKDFTLQIEKLIETKTYGTFNTVCKGDASRYDVAVEFLKLLNLQDKIKINKVSSDYWSNYYFAPRPDSEKLLTTKLDTLELNVMRPWKEALGEYIKIYQNYFKMDGN